MAVPKRKTAEEAETEKASGASPAEKKIPKPVWWKNTYFGISILLVILGIVGLIAGENAIRDPGQKREHGLVWLYFVGAVIMLINGLLSHSQTVQHYHETINGEDR